MYDQLKKSLTKHNKCLLLGHFISEVCKSKGIKASIKDGKMNPSKAFDYSLLSGDEVKEGSNEGPAENRQPCPASNPTIKDLFGLMQQIYQQQSELISQNSLMIEKMMKKLTRLTNFLDIDCSSNSDEEANAVVGPSTSMDGDQPMEEDTCAH